MLAKMTQMLLDAWRRFVAKDRWKLRVEHRLD